MAGYIGWWASQASASELLEPSNLKYPQVGVPPLVGTLYIRKNEGAYALTAYSTILLFENVPLTGGETIASAVIDAELTVGEYVGEATLRARVYGYDADNPPDHNTTAPWTTPADVNAAAVTAGTSTTFDIAEYPPDVEDFILTSNDFTAALQEIIDRPGWAAGNNLILFLVEFASTTDPNSVGGVHELGFAVESVTLRWTV